MLGVGVGVVLIFDFFRNNYILIFFLFLMEKRQLRNLLLTIGIFWALLGFIIWISVIPTIGGSPKLDVVYDLIFWVVIPALVLIFVSIILSVKKKE